MGRAMSCVLPVSVMLIKSILIGCLIDLDWIFASFLILVCLKYKSRGGIPAANSTV